MIGVALALIAITIALTAVGFTAMLVLVRRIEETQLRQISADTTAQKMIDQRIGNIITAHNATIDRYDERLDEKDDEVKMIISRLDQIVADIAELNKENISDHRDLVDIRMRYINYRTPVQSNGGVDWAPEYPDQEDEHAEND